MTGVSAAEAMARLPQVIRPAPTPPRIRPPIGPVTSDQILPRQSQGTRGMGERRKGMDGLPVRSLFRELSETVLLLAIAACTLGGYLGIALFFVSAMK